MRLAAALLALPLLAPPVPEPEEDQKWVRKTLDRMSLEQKVGQLIFGGASSEFTNVESAEFQRIQEEIQTYKVGGYHAFPGQPYAAAHLIRRMQQAAGDIPLLITADLEGGAGIIFQGATRFPRGMALGAAGDPDLVREIARVTALEGRQLGVRVSFSPVADINNNPLNPVINIRSFGEDPQRVSELVAAYVEGLQSEGVLATVKHFPGHGDTSTDSHLQLPEVSASLERLIQLELVPFRRAIDQGVAAVMTAHVSVPGLEPFQSLPATLSPRVVSDLLRQEMGFKGLIVTDAMNMAGVTNGLDDGQAALQAIQAGADVVLFPRSVARAHSGILQGVRSKGISEDRIDESVRRILNAKARLGLHRQPFFETDRIDEVVGAKEHLALARHAIESAITLVRDEKSAIPLRPGEGSTLLVLTLLDQERRGEGRGRAFVREARDQHPQTLHFEFGPEVSQREIQLTIELARRVGSILVGAYASAGANASIELSKPQMSLLERLSSLDRRQGVVVFGSPYLLRQLPFAACAILAFEDYPEAERAGARVALGVLQAKGTLPIRLFDSPTG